MPFDPATAKADDAGATAPPQSTSFDPSTAKPGDESTTHGRRPIGSTPPNLNDPRRINLQAEAGAAAERAAEIKKKADVALGHDPDVDYSSGLSFGDRIAMAKLDNDTERQMYLERKYGPGSVTKDSRGRMVVNKSGKKTAVGKPGLVPSVIGEATPMALGTLGAEAASIFSPETFGLAPAIGFGLGAGAGKVIDQIIKSAYGLQSLTLPQQFSSEAKEAALGMTGEMAGRGIGAAVNRATRGPIPEVLGGQTAGTRELTELTTKGGAVPPTHSALPDAKRIQWHQMFARRIAGKSNAQESANQEFIDTELKNILRESGVPKDQLDTVFEAIVNPKAAMSTREMGEDLQRTVKAHVENLQSIADTEANKVSADLDSQFSHLDKIISRFKPGDLGIDVAKGITTARKQFSTSMGKAYQRVDQVVGDEPLVPTARIRSEANKVLASMPKDNDGKVILSDERVVTALQGLQKIGDKISFADAQKIRTSLGELGELKDLVPGVSKRQYMDLRNSVNVALKLAGSDPRAAQAKRLLDQADALYSKGIKKFEDTTVNKLVRDAETGIVPDPDVIAQKITRDGYTERAETIKGLVGEKVWQRVAAADWKSMVEDVTRANPDRGDVIDGRILRKTLRDRGTMLDTVYGPRVANEIRKYAERLATSDGKIPIEGLEPGTFKTMVEAREKAKTELDAFMKDNYLSALADPKEMPDVALDWIVRPEQESRLIRAFQFFKEGSPQVASIRQAALHDLLSRATATTESGVGRRVSPEGIEKALQKLTPAQQELLFPNGLADDIRLLAQETKFLYPDLEHDMSAGLAAGMVKNLPMVVYAPIAAYAAAWSWMLGKPGVIRFLALGLRGDNRMRTEALRAIRVVSRQAALGSVPDTEATK